jgi:hypothetical protein
MPGPLLRRGFDAVQQIGLADDADHPISGIDNGHPADPALRKKCRQRLHRCVRGRRR